jgi:hypothetical protein
MNTNQAIRTTGHPMVRRTDRISTVEQILLAAVGAIGIIAPSGVAGLIFTYAVGSEPVAPAATTSVTADPASDARYSAAMTVTWCEPPPATSPDRPSGIGDPLRAATVAHLPSCW